jgi:glycosyltransferase involved in cell wall biosynthesis
MKVPRLLYVTPVAPAFTGNGLAMRAAMILEALREICEVSVVMPGQSPSAGAAYDIVHVFRLAGLALAKPYLDSAGRRHLDLDDIESKTHKRIAALFRGNGEMEAAERELAESRRCELLEVAVFRKFDRVYVCSDADRDILAPRCPAELVVLPNAVRLPDALPHPPRRDPSQPFRFLFIGTIGYYPNFDACVWLCREVLPILKRTAPFPFLVNIAGSDSGRLPIDQEFVRILGAVPDVSPIYEAADAVIVPLRAGGGTRIKILEAFSYRRPVVATSIGAEGLNATAGTDLLLADTPEAFAARCVGLMTDRDLACRLAENALRLVKGAYSAEALKQIVCTLPEAPIREGFRPGAGSRPPTKIG